MEERKDIMTTLERDAWATYSESCKEASNKSNEMTLAMMEKTVGLLKISIITVGLVFGVAFIVLTIFLSSIFKEYKAISEISGTNHSITSIKE